MTEDQPQKLILSAEMTASVALNQSVTVELQTSDGSAAIQSLSFSKNESLLQTTTNANGTVVIDHSNFSVTYIPAWGYHGADQITVYVTSVTLQTEAYPITFLVGNDGSKSLSDINALVYGSLDATSLSNKLRGYAPPSMADIFQSWSRFGGGVFYPAGTVPAGDAVSWALLAGPERISCTINSGSYTGFVSSASFESYTHEAILTSPDNDDDMITVIIAFTQVGNDFYTLSAMRTKGGFPLPLSGWGVGYHKNGTLEFMIADKAVDGKGAVTGWSNEKSKVQVIRTGDTIVAKTSNWNTNESFLILDPASVITVDLNSDARLAKFKGAQRYGYGSYSQKNTTFLNVNFSTGLDDKFVYDLVKNYVYERANNGTYVLRQDIDAYDHVGYPRKVTNPDTGRTYVLKANKTYELKN